MFVDQGNEDANSEELEVTSVDKRQPLIPLFVLAVLTMAFGFYFVFFQGVDPAASAGDITVVDVSAVAPEADGFDSSAGAVKLAYKFDAGQSRHYQLVQTSSRVTADTKKTAPVKVIATFDVEVAPRKDKEAMSAESFALSLDFDSARVRVEGDGQPVGQTVTSQLDALLSKASAVAEVDVIGQVDGYLWTSASNPQVQATLSLIQDSVMMLQPRMLRAEVNVGEVWTYEIPLPGKGAEGLEVTGAVTVQNKLLGKRKAEAGTVPVWLIEQTLAIAGNGSYLTSEAGLIAFEVKGGGRGVVSFDADSGALERYELVLEQDMVMTAEGEGPVTRETKYELLTHAKR